MSETSHFKLDVTFTKGQNYSCNVTLKCCGRKDLTQEDILDLLNQRFPKKFKPEDFTYKHVRVAHHDHLKLHDDGFENAIIKISKKESAKEIHVSDNAQQHESIRVIELNTLTPALSEN